MSLPNADPNPLQTDRHESGVAQQLTERRSGEPAQMRVVHQPGLLVIPAAFEQHESHVDVGDVRDRDDHTTTQAPATSTRSQSSAWVPEVFEHVTEDHDVELVVLDLGQQGGVEVDDMDSIGEVAGCLGGFDIDLDTDDRVPGCDEVFGDMADRATHLDFTRCPCPAIWSA